MKLRQKEYCHNCDNYVTFEFDDVNVRQVIICPSCGHEHWRELDDTTILNIRAVQGMRTIKIAKIPEPNWAPLSANIPLEPSNITYEEREVTGSEDGKVVVKAKTGENSQKRISNRRWGRDSRQ